MEILALILFFVGIIGLVFVGMLIENMDYPNAIATIILFLMLIMISIVIFVKEWGDMEYKQGQVDALTGEVKYELKTNKDSTRMWIKKDNGE